MSGNIFVFWKESADPPSPWTRLTRQGRYVRFTDSVAYHLATTGAASHYHGNTMSSCSIGNCNSTPGTTYWDDIYDPPANHNHPCPSWSISSNDNNPAWYGLDIIYMNLATWEAYEKRFPDGAVVLSSQVLSDLGYMSRFTAADGKYIVNTTPTATGGVTENKQHYCQGRTGNGGSTKNGYNGSTDLTTYTPISHPHDIAAWSSANTNEPRNLTTRLYEILALTISAKTGTVVFCDGTPGANWEIQSGWTTANLKSGDSNPTLSGSDSHSQSISGNTGSGVGLSAVYTRYNAGSGYNNTPDINHVHSVSATLATESHVPQSSLLVPMKLLNDLWHGTAQRGAQLIGLVY